MPGDIILHLITLRVPIEVFEGHKLDELDKDLRKAAKKHGAEFMENKEDGDLIFSTEEIESKLYRLCGRVYLRK